jgi:NAD(P)H dehydrogenase (quinone)
MTSLQKPTVLVLGVSGQIGRFVLERLDKYPETLNVRVTARRPEQVAALQQQGRDGVLLDLDNPATFAAALHGVDRVFLLTGYTVAMLTQSKTFVDAARKARVQHIVHLGVFGRWDCTDPHIGWHQLIETYIEASGISWTHIHPNMFMEQIPKFMKIRNDRFPIFWGPGRMAWIAAQDVGSVVATVLREGPVKHGGQNYCLSAEIAGGEELATIFSEVLGRPISCDYKKPEDFAATMALTGDYSVEPWYAAGALEFLKQFSDGRMGDFGTVRDDTPYLTGEKPRSLQQWAQCNHSLLVSQHLD